MSEDATAYQAIKGEGGEPQLGEGGGEFILPEGGAPRVIPPPPPMPVVVALCPGVECCDLSPFVYAVRRIPPSLTVVASGVCSTCLNTAFSTYITATGIGPALTWTIESGALPAGLSFHGGYNENGKVLIDGTPTVSGSFSITVKALSPTGASVITTLPITVFGITTTSLPNFVIGQFYSAQLAATGGSGNYGWSIQSGSLPDGLVLSPITGSITGTPTGLNSGTQPVVFQVVDITCEQFNPVFVPQARISATSSTTQIATVLGYDEFIPSLPPKRYHTATWAGTSEHQMWLGGDGSPFTPPVATQIGGARYDFSGFDHIDTHGTVDSTHVKNYSVECNGDAGRIYSMVLGAAVGTFDAVAYNFRGYIGTEIGVVSPGLLGHSETLCGSPSLPYSLVGNVAIAGPADFSDLWGSHIIEGTINLGISNVLTSSSTVKQSIENGTVACLVERYLPLIGVNYDIVLPRDFYLAGSIIYNHAYSVTLSDEYTDAEALANAQVSLGNSRTAENLPRTTGFVNRFTVVNYDITCSNLVPGSSYTVTTQLIDVTAGTTSVLTETFTASSDTKVINHDIPTPLPGHSVTVTNPTIAFA